MLGLLVIEMFVEQLEEQLRVALTGCLRTSDVHTVLVYGGSSHPKHLKSTWLRSAFIKQYISHTRCLWFCVSGPRKTKKVQEMIFTERNELNCFPFPGRFECRLCHKLTALFHQKQHCYHPAKQASPLPLLRNCKWQYSNSNFFLQRDVNTRSLLLTNRVQQLPWDKRGNGTV